MFWTYGELWLGERLFTDKDYNFNSLSEFPYQVPDFPEIQKYHEYLKTFPEKAVVALAALRKMRSVTSLRETSSSSCPRTSSSRTTRTSFLLCRFLVVSPRTRTSLLTFSSVRRLSSSSLCSTS